MKSGSWVLLLIFVAASSVLCACVTYSDADYYVLTPEDAKQLAVDGAAAAAEEAEITPRLRVDCKPSDDSDEHICDEIEVGRQMPMELWRPGFQSLQLQVFEFQVREDAIYDLDGEIIADISDVDVIALQTAATSGIHSSRIHRSSYLAGLVTSGFIIGVAFVLAALPGVGMF